jgi:glycosyltransferase involved in cell wall biosynthesis
MRIALVCNQVLGGWSPLDPDGMSGGEEIVWKFSAALADAGHVVHVQYDGEYLADGNRLVTYLPRNVKQGDGYDLAIYFKCPELYDPTLAPRAYLWTDQERPFVPDPFVRVVACSQYLARYLDSMVPRASSRLTVIPYGIDCAEVLAAGEGITRDPLEVLHCASPDRGLDVFLDLWPRVLERVPEAKLTIAYGWELYDKYGGSRALKAKIVAQIAALTEQGAAITMNRLSRLEMHQALHRASVYAYWCTGGEQFGLTPLKAQLAGCVPVVKPWGALHETVLAEYRIEHRQTFINLIEHTLKARVHEHDGNSSHERRLFAERFDWPAIVEQWERLWQWTDAEAAHPHPTSDLVQIPGPPPFAEPTGYNVAAVVHPTIAEWMQAMQPKAPYIDPSLGFPPGAVDAPDKGDAVLLGFGLEDAVGAPGQWLKLHHIHAGTPVCLLVSHGLWRARQRRRLLSPEDVRAILGQQPELVQRSVSLGQDGEGLTLYAFRYQPERVLADRDRDRARRCLNPRQTLSVCYMVRDCAHTIGYSLKSVEAVADEVVLVDTGSVDATAAVVEDWARRTGIAVRYARGTSPRHCFDCGREHGIGEMAHGHRVAGFETPRNESIALARGDHILWLDADEELLHANPGALNKYLRPNLYAGYGIQQHHHSVNPPEAGKIDYPVRCFRRVPDGEAGSFAFGPHQWPTYHSGLTARFTGIVHEHPGFGPGYVDGLGPVIILSDVWISHKGYLTEDYRRKRFVRNWPLMVADRLKYPERRLGQFLFVRDLAHQARYLIESAGGRVTPEAHALASEGWRIFCDHFAERVDAYAADAAMFASTCAEIIGVGQHYEVSIKVKKPEMTGEDAIVAQFAGRFRDRAQALAAAGARLADTDRWEGPYA